MQKYLYLIINILSFLPPFVLSFDEKVAFYKKWKYLIPSIAIVAIPFIVWDEIFTQIGVWGFNPKYLSGLYVFSLPFEEVMFFIAIPYACVFTYEVISVYIKKKVLNDINTKYVSIILIIFLTTLLIKFYEYIYTSITLTSLILSILIFQFFLKFEEIGRFYFSYLIILVPFLIVNGILTGSFIVEPIVWYNNKENMSLRLFTIPFEDIFYGMLLILLNVFLFERFQKLSIKNFF